MDSKQAILDTVAYSDIFDFPLTVHQIWEFLISPHKLSKAQVTREVQLLIGSELSQESAYICLNGREMLFALRKKRRGISMRKRKEVQHVLTRLSKIPSVQLLAISGSLARLNGDKDADIDLFVITSAQTLWTTRLIMLIYLHIIGKRRFRNGRDTADKICLNLFIDTEHLQFVKKQQDLYIANEICQLSVVFQRNNCWRKFIKNNAWIAEQLPNWHPQSTINDGTKNIFLLMLMQIIEPICRWVQLYRIKKHQTTEKVSNGMAAFHPRDYHTRILKKFRRYRRHIRLSHAHMIKFTYGTLTNTPRFSILAKITSSLPNS